MFGVGWHERSNRRAKTVPEAADLDFDPTV